MNRRRADAAGVVALKLLVALIVAAATLLACLIALRSRPVLYRYYETGNPIHEPAIAIFNPLRDREPERLAEEFLKGLRTGACSNLMRELSASAEFQQQTCEHESSNRIISRKLRNRTDEPSKVKLYFSASHETQLDLASQLWVTLELNGTSWRVIRYDRYY